MVKKYLNKFKLDKIKQIENNYKYIYIFRYNDLNYNEIVILKKEIKKLNLNFFILKQNLIKFSFINLKGQGSLITIYGNHLLNYNIIKKLKKLELIYLLIDKKLYSNLNLKKNLNDNLFLNYHLKLPFIYFINLLNLIK